MPIPDRRSTVMALTTKISRLAAPGAASPAAVVAVIIITGLLAAQPSLALPQLWVADIAKADCGQHPKQAYGQHRDPVADRSGTVAQESWSAAALEQLYSHMCPCTTLLIRHFGLTQL